MLIGMSRVLYNGSSLASREFRAFQDANFKYYVSQKFDMPFFFFLSESFCSSFTYACCPPDGGTG